MQRLLALTITASLAASYAGCAHRQTRPVQCAPSCVQAPMCTPGIETYGAPTITTIPGPPSIPGTVPSLSPQTVPGPETYTPSNP